jgi:putative NIF3 family GTP cyclohydrolase 1 type 2
LTLFPYTTLFRFVLHHGMFWAGARPLVGAAYRRLQRLMAHDVAVYAAHLPLDAHPRVGNCARLAAVLGLAPSGRFLEYQGVPVGVSGTTDMATTELTQRLARFAAERGGTVRASEHSPAARSRQWAIVTGAGADSAALLLAAARGVDTLIVGEGPHHTTVDAPDGGVTVIYAGHYASETPGVEALAVELRQHFNLPAEFLLLPTGS